MITPEIKEKVKEKWGNDIDKPETIQWKMEMSMSFDDKHSLLYRSKYMGYGIQMEINTPKDKYDNFGEGVSSFFIDGDEREFKTQHDMLVAIHIKTRQLRLDV